MSSHSRPRRIKPLLTALAVLPGLAVASCGGDPPVTPIDPEPPEPDRPAALAVHAGDGQSAATGAPVPDPIQVRVTGTTGGGLGDVTVSFQVTEGDGSVESASAMTDGNGIASPGRWTLGAAGQQQLRATVAGLPPVTFSATALAIPAEIAVAAGASQMAWVGSEVAVPPEVLVTDANGSPLAGIRVFFSTEPDAVVAGADSVTNADGRASAGSWTLGTVPDVYWLEARLEETGITGNPVRFEAVARAGPPAEVLLVDGDGQESEVKFPVAVPPRVRVRDPLGNDIAGVKVSFEAGGGSAVIPTEAETDSLGLASVEKWVLGPEPGISYELTASVREGSNTLASATFTATATPPVYDIEIVYANPGDLHPSHRAAFDRAEQLWETAITGNLPWSTVRKQHLQKCLDDGGIGLVADGDRIVNDVLIYASVDEIDGPARTLAAAGPCQIRKPDGPAAHLPIVGTIRIDVADASRLDSIALEGTIVHEMAHVLGFGTIWEPLGLLQGPATNRGGNPHFTGDSAIAAFARIGGERYSASNLVPVQGVGGEGVQGGHWLELVFVTELMTPFINKGPNPLSIVTIASMMDLGYEGVDLDVADDFTLPSDLGPPLPAGPIEQGTTGSDILRVPIAVVNRNGNVVRYIPPGQSQR